MKLPQAALLAAMVYVGLSLAGGSVRAQSAEVPLPREGAVVERGDAVVDFGLIDAYLTRIPAQRRAGYMNDPERIEILLQALLVNLQLAHDAEQSGLGDDELTRNVLALMRAELLAKRRMQQVMQEMHEPDFEQLARERYLSSPSAFRSPETRDLRHLVVLHRNHGVDGARATAEELLERFREGDTSFEEFVREHSEEETAKADGGLLKGVTGKDLDKGFYAAAFALKEVGDISEPVMSRYGYHLIQLVEVKPAARQAFDAVKDSIIASLRREFSARKRTEYLDNLKAAAQLKADPELVAALRTRYLPDGAGAEVLAAYDRLGQGPVEDAAGSLPEEVPVE